MQMSYTDEFEIKDLEERKLFINCDVDESLISEIVYHILRYNKEDKDIEVSKRKPILLYINSRGGSLPDGYGVIDAIRTSKTPVYTINQGRCFSMGFLIFIAGVKRYAMPSAEFLLHDGSTASWDSTAKALDRAEFEKNFLEPMTKRYVLEQTKITEELYKAQYRAEWYMLPEEAKEQGVCTHIVGVDCTIDDII